MSVLDKIESEVRKNFELRINELKLKAIDGLSVGFGRLLSLMTIIAAGTIASAAIAFGMVALLSELLGSWSAAAFIIGGIALLIFAILIILRKRLYRNLFVKLFISIFYDN